MFTFTSFLQFVNGSAWFDEPEQNNTNYMQLLLITCLGVITDSGRCVAVGWTGGGVVGREGKLASFCKVVAVSAKPNKAHLTTARLN